MWNNNAVPKITYIPANVCGHKLLQNVNSLVIVRMRNLNPSDSC